MGPVTAADDLRYMTAALALSSRGQARTVPNPNVGCVIVRDGRVVGRGWTQPGGRPHAEAMALVEAGASARGATAYVTLEPCAHVSPRGSSCAQALIDAGIDRVVFACTDPDSRTNGKGAALLQAAGVKTALLQAATSAARSAMAGWFSQGDKDRPFVTLKLATSIDGCISLANGTSKWITGEAARAHAHGERARSNAILVGRGTMAADAPSLDVRLEGLEARSPKRLVLTRGEAPEGWVALSSPEQIATLQDCHYLLVEGGAQTAAAFLAADLVDRLMLYRAPIMIGAGRAALADIGLGNLSDAHGRWLLADQRCLGCDTLEVYDRDRMRV